MGFSTFIYYLFYSKMLKLMTSIKKYLILLYVWQFIFIVKFISFEGKVINMPDLIILLESKCNEYKNIELLYSNGLFYS